MSENDARAPHDIGGVSTFLCLPVDTGAHELDDFDRRVDAIRQILGQKGVMGVDELRRGIEGLPEATYYGLSYYQRWLHAILGVLIAKGVITAADLTAALEAA